MQLLRHLLRDLGGNHLEHDGKGTGGFQRLRIGEQPLGVVTAALDAIAAESVLTLRGEADVRHHRDAGVDDRLHLVGDLATAFELDGVRVTFLHEAHSGVQCLTW